MMAAEGQEEQTTTGVRKIVKYIIILIAITNLLLIAVGLYFKNYGQYELGDKMIGFGALGTAFVLMPIFIIYRYSEKGVKNYMFPHSRTEEDDSAKLNE